MLRIDIPGFRSLSLDHLVLDFNGTLASDGRLINGVGERFGQLAEVLEIHVVTADTYGGAARELEGLPCRVAVIPRETQDEAKNAYLLSLGADRTVAVGNGRNDRLMLKTAAIGIAVMQSEGTAGAALLAADLVVTGILPALDLLSEPKRLIATLRN